VIAKINAEFNRFRLTSPQTFAASSDAARMAYNREVNQIISSSSSPLDTFGGADRDRTDDPLLAKQVLSQLSYSPGRFEFGGMRNVKC
jgi:hypothetical protein